MSCNKPVLYMCISSSLTCLVFAVSAVVNGSYSFGLSALLWFVTAFLGWKMYFTFRAAAKAVNNQEVAE